MLCNNSSDDSGQTVLTWRCRQNRSEKHFIICTPLECTLNSNPISPRIVSDEIDVVKADFFIRSLREFISTREVKDGDVYGDGYSGVLAASHLTDFYGYLGSKDSSFTNPKAFFQSIGKVNGIIARSGKGLVLEDTGESLGYKFICWNNTPSDVQGSEADVSNTVTSIRDFLRSSVDPHENVCSMSVPALSKKLMENRPELLAKVRVKYCYLSGIVL